MERYCKVVHDGQVVYTGTYEDCVDFTEIYWEYYPGMDIIPD